MKRSSTLILGAMTALVLAACNSQRNAAGGAGSESGSMRSDTAMGTDTTMGHSGMSDTTRKDTTR